MAIRRLLAYLIDCISIFAPYFLIRIIFPLSCTYILACYLFALFFCKDGFTGQSLGKRIMELQVIHKNMQVSPLRALGRNLFYIIWPIELVILLVYNERIGDIVCKCQVIRTTNIRGKFSTSCCVLVLVLGCVIYCIMLYAKSNPLLSLLDII